MIARLLKPWSRKSLSLANGIVGRALLADPDWKLKVRDGRTKDLLPFDRSALATLA